MILKCSAILYTAEHQYSETLIVETEEETKTNKELAPISCPFKELPFEKVPELNHYLSYKEWKQVLQGYLDSAQGSVSYVSLSKAIKMIRECRKGSLMAKADIESAFHLLPEHPDSFHLLGF